MIEGFRGEGVTGCDAELVREVLDLFEHLPFRLITDRKNYKTDRKNYYKVTTRKNYSTWLSIWRSDRENYYTVALLLLIRCSRAVILYSNFRFFTAGDSTSRRWTSPDSRSCSERTRMCSFRFSRFTCARSRSERVGVRTGSWTGPPRGGKGSKGIGISSTVFGVRA